MSIAVALASAAVVLLGAAGVRPHPAGHRQSGPRPRHAARRPGSEPLIGWLDTVAREVRGGCSLTAALHIAGTQPRASARDAADHAVAAHALALAGEIGGPIAATLDAAAAVLRERQAVRADAAAHSAQARLSARVLTTVPVAFVVFAVATSGATRRAAMSPAGAACMVAGAALNGAGWWWMRRVIRQAAR